jgi:hypothetical protein
MWLRCSDPLRLFHPVAVAPAQARLMPERSTQRGFGVHRGIPKRARAGLSFASGREHGYRPFPDLEFDCYDYLATFSMIAVYEINGQLGALKEMFERAYPGRRFALFLVPRLEAT